MANRREFDKKAKVAIKKRCERPTGWACEICGAIVASGHIDHIDPDALQIDKKRKLTAEEGQFLCEPCHAEKTKDDVRVIAKVKRVEANHLGAKAAPAKKIESAGFKVSEKTIRRQTREQIPLPPRRPLYVDK